jgi:hypothetical protein
MLSTAQTGKPAARKAAMFSAVLGMICPALAAAWTWARVDMVLER